MTSHIQPEDWRSDFRQKWEGANTCGHNAISTPVMNGIISDIENLLEQERQRLGWKTHDCREMLSTEIENAVEQERESWEKEHPQYREAWKKAKKAIINK